MTELKHLKEKESSALSCVACGQCRTPRWLSKGKFGVCPVYETDYTPKFEPFFARGKNMILRGILWDNLPLSRDLAEIFFQCSLCGACEEFCHNADNPNIEFATHKWIDNVAVYEALRADLVEAGFSLEEHREMNEFLINLDNPYGRDKTEKLVWTEDLDFEIKDALNEPIDVLFYVGCTSALSPSTRVIAKSTAKILNKLNVNFGILGDKEICCGSVAKRTGDLKAFNYVLEKNVDLFKNIGIKKIVTSCAGCYRTFVTNYAEKLEDIEILHTSEFIIDLLKEKGIDLNKLDIKTTYHDPCHLGRHCDFYEPPREILNQISDFKEMQRIKKSAMCCGAGGGVKKAFAELAMEMAINRVKEAEETGAALLVSTCPFCHRNLFDAIAQSGANLKMQDLTELILQSLE